MREGRGAIGQRQGAGAFGPVSSFKAYVLGKAWFDLRGKESGFYFVI
jgi:hypothetical protein